MDAMQTATELAADPDTLNVPAYTPNNLLGIAHYAAMVASIMREVDGTEFYRWVGRFTATPTILDCWDKQVSPLNCAKRLCANGTPAATSPLPR